MKACGSGSSGSSGNSGGSSGSSGSARQQGGRWQSRFAAKHVALAVRGTSPRVHTGFAHAALGTLPCQGTGTPQEWLDGQICARELATITGSRDTPTSPGLTRLPFTTV